MFVLANFCGAAAHVINILLSAYTWMIIIRALVSWVSPDPFNPIMIFLTRATDPLLQPFRRIIPMLGPIDISPMAALLVLQALQLFLVRTLLDLSMRLR